MTGRMLGKAAQCDRGKNFWWCCWGHDGWNRSTRIIRKKRQRAIEKREVRNMEIE